MARNYHTMGDERFDLHGPPGGPRSLRLNVGGVFVILFKSTSCGHCERFKPIFERVAEEFRVAGRPYQFGVVDIYSAEGSRITSKVKAVDAEFTGIPSVFLFIDGRLMGKIRTASRPELWRPAVERAIATARGGIVSPPAATALPIPPPVPPSTYGAPPIPGGPTPYSEAAAASGWGGGYGGGGGAAAPSGYATMDSRFKGGRWGRDGTMTGGSHFKGYQTSGKGGDFDRSKVEWATGASVGVGLAKGDGYEKVQSAGDHLLAFSTSAPPYNTPWFADVTTAT